MKRKVIVFMPSIEGGGVEKNLFIVTNYLAKKLKNVSLITISKKFKKKFDRSINFLTYESDIWDIQPRRFKYLLSLFILIREIIKDKNVLVFAFQANIYCIILCKLFGVKIVVRSNSAPIGWSRNFIKKIIFKFFLNKADQVMVNSFEFKKSLKQRFNVEATCIYNPLDKKNIIKKSKIKSQKYFKSKNKLRILNIGRFTEQKDQLTFLKSLNELKNKIDFEAIILGRGILKEELENYISKNDLKSHVKIFDFVGNPYPIIKQCELFILTSKYEGLPNVLLETATLKKFIISSNCETGPKEILMNGKGGFLFKVSDHKKLTNKIISFHQNKNKSKKMINLNFENLYRFDYIKNLNKYLNLVKENL